MVRWFASELEEKRAAKGQRVERSAPPAARASVQTTPARFVTVTGWLRREAQWKALEAACEAKANALEAAREQASMLSVVACSRREADLKRLCFEGLRAIVDKKNAVKAEKREWAARAADERLALEHELGGKLVGAWAKHRPLTFVPLLDAADLRVRDPGKNSLLAIHTLHFR